MKSFRQFLLEQTGKQLDMYRKDLRSGVPDARDYGLKPTIGREEWRSKEWAYDKIKFHNRKIKEHEDAINDPYLPPEEKANHEYVKGLHEKDIKSIKTWLDK